MSNKSPCYKCEERNADCHSTCEKYLEYHAKNKERLELKKKQFAQEHDEREFKILQYQKFQKNKRRK